MRARARDPRRGRRGAVALLNLERVGVVQIENATAGSIARAVPDEDAAASKADARRLRKEWTEHMQSEAELAPRATTIAATGSRPRAESCRLEVGLAEFVATRNESMLEAIATDPGVEDCAHALRADLVDRGYLLDDGTLGRLRWLRIVWLPLLALGVVRLATKVSEGRPVGFLVLALLVTVAFVFGRTLPDAPPLVQAQVKHAATARSRDDVERAFVRDGRPLRPTPSPPWRYWASRSCGRPRPRTPSPSPSPTRRARRTGGRAAGAAGADVAGAVVRDAPAPHGLGLGIAWRPEVATLARERHDLGFVDVIAETVSDSRPVPRALTDLARRGVRVIPHGVGLSLGGAAPLDPARVQFLRGSPPGSTPRW